MMKEDTAIRLGLTIIPADQLASQADGKAMLDVVGETRCTVRRDNLVLKFEGLVVRNLDDEVLAGSPFMEVNDISIRPAKKEITFSDGSKHLYRSRSTPAIPVRRAHVVRAPDHDVTVYPGDFIETKVPDEFADSKVAVEPRIET